MTDNYLEEMRLVYRRARENAKNGDNNFAQSIIDDIQVFSDIFKEKYNDKSTPIMQKIVCKRQYESFDAVIQVIKYYGLQDRRVQVFFGFVRDGASASFGDIASGRGAVAMPDTKGLKPIVEEQKPEEGGLDEDLFRSEPEAEQKPKAEPALPETAIGEEPQDPADSIDDKPEQPEEPESTVKGRPSFKPESLDDFIGQEHVVKRIQAEIKAAKKRGEKHIDNILLLGNRGLGKSTLMELIAKELGVRFEFMDASSLNNDVASQRKVSKFLQRISRAGEPVVIAFDEIHALPTGIQTALLTLLNSRVYSYLDDSGQTHSLPIEEFTFIGATTDADKILSTIKDRCNNLTFYLKDYTPEELRKIFINKFTARGFSVTDKALDMCIARCRSSIREVESFVKGLDTLAVNADLSTITAEMCELYFKDRELDAIGLRTQDIAILEAIYSDPAGVISADTLAARVHMDVKILTQEFEPYLLKIGFISINNRGRSLTDKAIRYLRPKFETEDKPQEKPAEEVKPEESKPEEKPAEVNEETPAAEPEESAGGRFGNVIKPQDNNDDTDPKGGKV